MKGLILAASFIFGSIVGSFLNVLVERIDKNESFIKGRSYCPYCKKTLSWWELIPIFSYFYLKGRCSRCKNKIPKEYPIVEFITGICFLFLTLKIFRFSFLNTLFTAINLEKIIILLNFGFWYFWVFILLAVSIYDIKKYLILGEILIPATIVSFIWRIVYGFFLTGKKNILISQFSEFLGSQSYIFGHFSYFLSLIFGIIFSFGAIALIVYLTKEKAMGWGDAILAFFIGLILGWPNALIAIILSFLLGGAISLILIIFKKKNLKSYLPFAPFLSLGTLLVMLFGDIMIKVYLSMFLI